MLVLSQNIGLINKEIGPGLWDINLTQQTIIKGLITRWCHHQKSYYVINKTNWFIKEGLHITPLQANSLISGASSRENDFFQKIFNCSRNRQKQRLRCVQVLLMIMIYHIQIKLPQIHCPPLINHHDCGSKYRYAPKFLIIWPNKLTLGRTNSPWPNKLTCVAEQLMEMKTLFQVIIQVVLSVMYSET